MIKPETIQSIVDTARIEEVVGDFVQLRKRGVNLLGLCPFHNEKTPSFTVSQAKGIFKCFGCGKVGNSVNFIMEHEHLTYPEALRYLAKKYFIEIEEEIPSAEQLQAISEKETQFNVCAFAQKYFTETLHQNEEGKAIGLSYFRERGFSEHTIEKFLLGYCLDKWDSFTHAATENGYKKDILVDSGLTISSDGRYYDRFKGRVMFPIQNISGRVIGFGGRILSADKSKAKYVNSPETEIYHKSNVLYGLFQAKSAIIAHENCYLVEGYTDVISMHQAGIENVVASSGTSLTVEQIRLIRRFTPNITILFDGDAAGIKASFRGIDMILEEGMNVRILLFPDGEDPDSYARKYRPVEVKEFIEKNAVDFISFKTRLLSEGTAGDPVKKAGLIKEIVNTIALIPDPIVRSVYVKECSEDMKVAENIVANEIIKIRQAKYKDKKTSHPTDSYTEEIKITAEPQLLPDINPSEYQEKELLRFLLTYGNSDIELEDKDEFGDDIRFTIKLGNFIVDALTEDEISFNNADYQLVYNLFCTELVQGIVRDMRYFTNHFDPIVSRTCVNIEQFEHELSVNWEKIHKITVGDERDNLHKSALGLIYAIKLKRVDALIDENAKKLKLATNEQEIIALQKRHITLTKTIRKSFADQLTIVISK